MMRAIVFAVALAFGVSGQASANVAPPEPPGAEDEAAGVIIAYLENFNAGSAEGILSTYSDSPGFIWVENGHVAYHTKADAAAGMATAMSAMKGSQLKTSMSDLRIVATGPDAMFAYVPLKISTPAASGLGERPTHDGVVTMTLVRESGEWRILSGHMATDPAP